MISLMKKLEDLGQQGKKNTQKNKQTNIPPLKTNKQTKNTDKLWNIATGNNIHNSTKYHYV